MERRTFRVATISLSCRAFRCPSSQIWEIMVRRVKQQKVAPDSNRYVARAARLLVVDDDVNLCELVAKYLEAEGFVVHAVHSGLEGETAALEGSYELIVLDVMLPDKKGFAILRRSGWQSEGSSALRPPVIRSGDLELDPSARAASRAGEVLHLTSAEYDILRLFVGSPGQVLTREKLVEHVLDRKFSPFDRSIDLHISNLRKKLGPHADGTERIRSIRGIGYLYTWPT
jgi:DNA-binding response OmpR family regulator